MFHAIRIVGTIEYNKCPSGIFLLFIKRRQREKLKVDCYWKHYSGENLFHFRLLSVEKLSNIYLTTISFEVDLHSFKTFLRFQNQQ
jgi:hypothetical protein